MRASSTGPGPQAEEAADPVLEEPLVELAVEPPEVLAALAELSEELDAAGAGDEDGVLLVSVEELDERLSVL